MEKHGENRKRSSEDQKLASIRTPDFMVIGFYTPTSQYPQLAGKLSANLCKFNTPHFFLPVLDRGNWQLNTMTKVDVIMHCLNTFENIDRFLYLDMDCQVMVDLEEETRDIELNLAFSAQKFTYNNHVERLGGTIYLKRSFEVLAFLIEWQNHNKTYPDRLEQENMYHAVVTTGMDYHILPPEMCFIYDSTREAYPNLKPKILHMQQSRLVKPFEKG